MGAALQVGMRFTGAIPVTTVQTEQRDAVAENYFKVCYIYLCGTFVSMM